MNWHPLRAVTDAELTTFTEDGFVQLRGMFDRDWIERMRGATDEMLAQPGPAGSDFNEAGEGGRMAFDKDMWLYNDDFRAFVYESPAAELAATILGLPHVNLVINVLLCKEPHTPTVTSFHQDITGNAVEGPVCGMRMSEVVPEKSDRELRCIPPDNGGIRDDESTPVYGGIQGPGGAGSAAGRQDDPADRGQAQGASEPGERLEAPGGGRSGRSVFERRQPRLPGS